MKTMLLVRLASLDLICGFVAAGRRMSITLASRDLCRTQSAVSRQINALEKQLGVKLLVRGYRSIAFTAEGKRLFRSADGALQQLQDVLGEISTRGVVRPVMLNASIGFTGLWLLPRLSRFQKLHRGVDLRVSANNRLADLRHDGIDLAIRYATASSVPEGATRLFGESVAPVAHPSLGLKSLRSEHVLAKVNLLEFDDPRHPWLQWRDWLVAPGRLELIQPLAAGKCVIHAVVSPEHLLAHEEGGSTENSSGRGGLGLRPQLQFVGVGLRRIDDLLGGEVELRQHLGHDLRGVDIAVLREVERHDAPAIGAHPGIFSADERHPQRQHRSTRKRARFGPGQCVLAALARHVLPHIQL